MRLITIFLILLTLTIAACSEKDPIAEEAAKILQYQSQLYAGEPLSGEVIDGVRHVHVKAYQFHFEPELIVVEKGQPLKLTIEAMDIPHGFEIEGLLIEGYDIDTKIRKGIPLDIDFTPTETGVWDTVCTIYCGFGHGDMKGTFVVRE